MSNQKKHSLRLGRRAFLHNGTLCLMATSIHPPLPIFADDEAKPLRVGLVTDLHFADKPDVGTRFYRQSLEKLTEARTAFAAARIEFAVELGDFIDAADSVETERNYLSTINHEFSSISPDRHYVLGNHCVDTLTKEEFLDDVEQQHSFYSFDRGSFHFVVLDACYRSDGLPYGRKNSHWTDANIPPAEQEWLKEDLNATSRKTVIFCHQRLDVANDHGVKNCSDVRRILQESGNVLAVFQGHSHQNDLKEIQGIHYCTLVAMVEGQGPVSSGYAVLELHRNGTIHLQGYRNQNSHDWTSPP